MALQTFWTSVRRAIDPYAYADAPTLTTSQLEEGLRKASPTTWLTPRSVVGFDPVDFDFLPDAERDRLVELVREFRAVVSGVSPTAPATAEQVERAVPLFRQIIEALAFDRFGDAEAYRIGKQVEQAIQPHWPPELVSLRFDTGEDHTGDFSLFISVYLSDIKTKAFLARAAVARRVLGNAARDAAPGMFPYISFHTAAGQQELRQVGAV